MKQTPVLIAGGGPVGMTLAMDLALRGIACMLVERNGATTQHPKMDITNARSMELFRRLGLAGALRRAAAPESQPLDVSWITSFVGHELHRFRYPSPARARDLIRATNDGSMPREPAMRASQVEVEPVLKAAIDAHDLVDVRFGVAMEDLSEDDDGVTAVLRSAGGGTESVRCRYLVGCDGGGSRVRNRLDIALGGEARIMQRYMTHFRSDAGGLLQRWGPAWHHQSSKGTLIAQNDRDTWTLHTRVPPGAAVDTIDPGALIRAFVGADIPHVVLVANPWEPHLMVAERYGARRVFLAGDAAHQYIPTGGYGMNTGIGDAADLGWKLAATLHGFGGPHLLAAYEVERRPVGLRNRDASRAHNDVRVRIAGLYADELEGPGEDVAARRAAAAAAIARIGNAENESSAIEMGYGYAGSPIVAPESDVEPPPAVGEIYRPSTVPGRRLPSTFLADGSALFDRLGPWFTLLTFTPGDVRPFVRAAAARGVPLAVLTLDEPAVAPVYQAPWLLVRPDQHVAWRGGPLPDADAARVVARAAGWGGD